MHLLFKFTALIGSEQVHKTCTCCQVEFRLDYSKTCLKRPLKKDQTLVIKTDYRLMRVKSIAECSNQLSTKFIMLINVKIPTIVGILTFISMLNATSKSWKAIKVGIFYEQLKSHANLN